MMYKQKIPGTITAQYSILKTVQVQLLSKCSCLEKKGRSAESSILDPVLTIPFFDAIR
ncbi:MAG TPA: hypothetical protein PK581_07465 [Caldisericia bacterium]|nr:hypothetical protein [Caldisericia bacterium]